jgi:hypothetical protein
MASNSVSPVRKCAASIPIRLMLSSAAPQSIDQSIVIRRDFLKRAVPQRFAQSFEPRRAPTLHSVGSLNRRQPRDGLARESRTRRIALDDRQIQVEPDERRACNAKLFLSRAKATGRFSLPEGANHSASAETSRSSS